MRVIYTRKYGRHFLLTFSCWREKVSRPGRAKQKHEYWALTIKNKNIENNEDIGRAYDLKHICFACCARINLRVPIYASAVRFLLHEQKIKSPGAILNMLAWPEGWMPWTAFINELAQDAYMDVGSRATQEQLPKSEKMREYWDLIITSQNTEAVTPC